MPFCTDGPTTMSTQTQRLNTAKCRATLGMPFVRYFFENLFLVPEREPREIVCNLPMAAGFSAGLPGGGVLPRSAGRVPAETSA